MNPDKDIDKLELRGNMTDEMKEYCKESKKAFSNSAHGAFFEIYVKGHLDDSWSDWLEGMAVTLLENGTMILYGYIRDQAALMGVLNKLYSLNLAFLSVSEVEQKNDVEKNDVEKNDQKGDFNNGKHKSI